MRAENKNGKIFAPLLVAGLLLAAPPARSSAPAATSPAQKAIHEAEDLSLSKERGQACAVLVKSLKKASKEDARALKDKLIQLSRYFYTDKGFSSFLAGKHMFEKQKFQDASDKLSEADDLENGNTEVLHYLTLTDLWLNKYSQADTVSKRALQLCPIDMELMRDSLSVQMAQELWAQATVTAQQLSKDFSDGSAQTLKDWAVSLIKQGQKGEAAKLLQQAVAKDGKFPEPYFWQATLSQGGEAVKLFNRYLELCKNRQNLYYQREPRLCAQTAEAEKRIKP